MTKRRCQQGLCNAPHVVALSRGTNELTGPLYYLWWLKFTAAVEGGSLPSRRLYNTSQGVQQGTKTLPCSPKCYHKPLTRRKPFRHKDSSLSSLFTIFTITYHATIAAFTTTQLITNFNLLFAISPPPGANHPGSATTKRWPHDPQTGGVWEFGHQQWKGQVNVERKGNLLMPKNSLLMFVTVSSFDLEWKVSTSGHSYIFPTC